jgi:hypothetical protein
MGPEHCTLSLTDGGGKRIAMSMRFHPNGTHLLVGDDQGTVALFKLSADFVQSEVDEDTVLKLIGDVNKPK